MRKVYSDLDPEGERLDKKIETYELHLAGCQRDFEVIADTRGHDEALKSSHARGIAQYSHVVDVLRGILDAEGEDKYKRALEEQARQAVSVLRDPNSSDWKRLAVATILEVLADVPS